MNKEMLKNLIELVPEKDIDTLYRVIIKFIPEVIPEPEELEAIRTRSYKNWTGRQGSERNDPS